MEYPDKKHFSQFYYSRQGNLLVATVRYTCALYQEVWQMLDKSKTKLRQK
jgi:hypothetical protein